MKTMKKLMMFAALAAISAPAFSNRYDAFKPVFDQMDKQIAEKSGDRITIWAYCKNTGNPFHDNSCKSALDRLSESSTAKPGFWRKKRSSSSEVVQAAIALGHLACTNSSLVAGVDVHRDDETISGNNITGAGVGMYGMPRQLSPEELAAAGVDKTQAQVVIESGIFIREGEELPRTPNDGYSLQVLQGKQRNLCGPDFHHVPEKFLRMVFGGAATNPKVSFPNYVYQEPKLVDYTSAAATL